MFFSLRHLRNKEKHTDNKHVYFQATPFRAVAEPGIQLKLVQSETGPGRIIQVGQLS